VVHKVVNRLRPGRQGGVDFRQEKGISSFSTVSRWALGPPNLLCIECRRLFSGDKAVRREAVRSLPSTAEITMSPWRWSTLPSTQYLKHLSNFTEFCLFFFIRLSPLWKAVNFYIILWCSGLWHHVVGWHVGTNVSEEHITSIIMVDVYPEDGSNPFLRKVFSHLPQHTVSLRRRLR
jgi:hypothetical protein